MMKKLLYIDVPFAGIAGGDTNRSSAIWSVLSRHYAADLLLIKPEADKTQALPQHSGQSKLFTLGSLKAPAYFPQAIHHFHKQHITKFRQILKQRQYDIVVLRFLSTFPLAEIVANELPEARIVIDVDMLFSRIAELSWNRDKSLHNRYHYLELQKLRMFERRAFSHSFSFFFTNAVERNMAIRHYNLNPDHAFVFPNMMPEFSAAPALRELPEKYILFFGTLNSMANSDALEFMMQDVYPGLKTILQENKVKLRIVGKNPLPNHEKYVDPNVQLLGPVDDIRSQIAGAMFVILPIRVASGTRTRILEAAATGTAIISTSIGAEGFNFAEDEILIADSAADFAMGVVKLIHNPGLCSSMGQKLRTAAKKEYSLKHVTEAFLANLVELLRKPESGCQRRNIAIITNRFYPEVGGAETNIYYQAKLLAKQHQITVFCPKRMEGPDDEKIDGFRVLRLPDLLNGKRQYPNLRSKTFCPSLARHLLLGKYDIVQCFPALNYNNILAYWIAKLKGIPYILCFFDFIDYAGHIKQHGKIDPDLLKNLKPKSYQLPVLKGMDYAFAIANKEIAFLKQFNANVDYSPVPILSEEYEHEVAKPALMSAWQEGNFVFLCLGRISNIKGQDIALKAFAQVAGEISEARLVFVGRSDYEPDFFAAMQEIVLQNNLEQRVHFTGMVERQEVLGWLRHSDLHVIPVRFMNSGAVVVESWISDTPVLQSDVVDPNLVQDGVNGYLFSNGSVSECAAKMLQAYRERDGLAALAKAGKELVMHKYTYDYLIGLYNNVYNMLLK